jgi:hypothetical protein
MHRTLLLALLLAVAVAVPARALGQDPRLAARLDAPTAARVEALLDSARTDGLPTEPLVQKALEGATMSASGDRIVRAVGTLLGNLRGARTALGTGASEADLVAGASSLRAGVPPAALQQLRATRPGQPLAVPLAVLTDLIARGVPEADAQASVLALAREGAGDAEFLALGRRHADAHSVPDADGRPRGMPAPGAPTAP